MRVRDKSIKEHVEVRAKECLNLACYWPRPDPGVFTQGRGYSQRAGGSRGYICGRREIHGCPDEQDRKPKVPR